MDHGQVESGDILDQQAVGFALGDVSEPWQQYIFDCLLAQPTNLALSVFAYAIWRERHFVDRFTMSELREDDPKSFVGTLIENSSVELNGLGNIETAIAYDWLRATAETLELLLGLLRTRASTNAEIKMVLQPHRKLTRELAENVERVAEIVAQSNLKLFSRVQINLQKPVGDRTPDLLYALRLYLTGDDGANAIHITRVSDNDDD